MEVLNWAVMDFASEHGAFRLSNTDHPAPRLNGFSASGLLASKSTQNDEEEGSTHHHESNDEENFSDGT